MDINDNIVVSDDFPKEMRVLKKLKKFQHVALKELAGLRVSKPIKNAIRNQVELSKIRDYTVSRSLFIS